MKKIKILCVGDLKEKYLKDAQNEYIKRISKYFDIIVVEVSEQNSSNANSKSQIEQIKLKEGKEILKKLKGYAIALCIDGKQEDSPAFAEHINSILDLESEITFIIGGSDGLSQEVIDCANEKLSFSKLTFPHQLMRVILLEQIYRAGTIIAGKIYHK